MPQFKWEVTFTILGVLFSFLAAVRKQRSISFGHLLDVKTSKQMFLLKHPSISKGFIKLSLSNWS